MQRALGVYKSYAFKLYMIWVLFGITTTIFTYLTSENDCITLEIPVVEQPEHENMDVRFAEGNITVCLDNSDCGMNQQCVQNECVCATGYVTVATFCGYKQSSQLIVFLLSFFVGGWGVDWFYLARGNACYNCAGVGKLLTCGGIGIWWLIDWIIILASGRNDGNGQPMNMNLI